MFEYRGAVHVHTTYSDGFGTAAEVLAYARRAGVQFLCITDHDTLAAAADPGEGWHDGLLVIVGSEISPPENHYLCFGLSHVPDRAQPPVAYVSEVSQAGGFGFAAHPFDKGNRRLGIKGYPWTAGEDARFDGLEIWNLSAHVASLAQSTGRLLLSLAAPGLYLRAPDTDVLALWDRLGAERRVPGIGGVDAHGCRGPLVRSGIVMLDYCAMFRTLQTRICLSEPLRGVAGGDVRAVLTALREGQSYICNASLGDPCGFAFTARDAAGVHPMGSEVAAAGRPRLTAVLPRGADMRLLCNGKLVARSFGARLEFTAEEPGVYRLEAWRRGWFGMQAWVLSNPIYVR